MSANGKITAFKIRKRDRTSERLNLTQNAANHREPHRLIDKASAFWKDTNRELHSSKPVDWLNE